MILTPLTSQGCLSGMLYILLGFLRLRGRRIMMGLFGLASVVPLKARLLFVVLCTATSPLLSVGWGAEKSLLSLRSRVGQSAAAGVRTSKTWLDLICATVFKIDLCNCVQASFIQ